MNVSYFRGFSKHKLDKDVAETWHEIGNGEYKNIVERVRLAMRTEGTEAASHIKKQIQAVTFSATYATQRLAPHITGYNDIVVLDFDNLPPDALNNTRQRTQQDPNTLFCFLSPGGSGLKVGTRLLTPQAAQLRHDTLQGVESITFEALERYHKTLFEMTRTHYEALTGVEVDASGSDIGRLCFLSHDPDIYVNRAALDALEVPQLSIIVPAPPATKALTPKQVRMQELPGNPTLSCDHIGVELQTIFRQAVAYTERNMTYMVGGRDSFLFALGNRCYRKKLPLEAAELLAQRHFHTPDMDVRLPIRNAYRYTGKTDAHLEEQKKPLARRVMEFADQKYGVRFNVVMKRNEFMDMERSKEWIPMKQRHYNTIFVDLADAGISCQPSVVKTIVNSHYAKDYNPFEEYFYNLPPWDGTTDYIDQLAATVQTTRQEFWRDCLKRWLVGMVACALNDDSVNQLALVLKGDQGKGKSRWIRNLLPPELRLHYRNGMINPNNKDHMLLLTMCILINLEEFEGMKAGEIGDLKRMITQESVTERKAFDSDTDLYVRRASIIASTNEPRFLEDATGNRRFPTVTTTEIDYTTPVNHAGVFAQALALWRQGFRHWYAQDEAYLLKEVVDEYTLASPEEELLYVHYAKATQGEVADVYWKSASEMLTRLALYGRILVNKRSTRLLTQILERDGFEKRKSEQGIVEYFVRQRVVKP